jgi:hypothetical protein
MKKSIFILIFLISGFFFLGTNYLTAQWCIDVTYSDALCDCGTITTKTVYYQIYDVVIEDYIVDDNEPLPVGGNYFELEGTEEIIWDAEDRYLVSVRITYFDPSQCCTGWDSKLVDGDQLTGCNVGIDITME